MSERTWKDIADELLEEVNTMEIRLDALQAERDALREAADQSITDLVGILNLSDDETVTAIAEHVIDALGLALGPSPEATPEGSTDA